MLHTIKALLLSLALVSMLGGCAALAGAGAAAGGYEYQTRQQIQELERQFEAGEITEQEYQRRREDLEAGSILR